MPNQPQPYPATGYPQGAAVGQPHAVIHDLGFRKFTGRRETVPAIAWSQYQSATLSAFGIGRSNKSKIMPAIIVLAMVVAGVVLAAVLIFSQSTFDDLDVKNLTKFQLFPAWTASVVALFAAIASPVLFSYDLRYRSIVLYFCRPLPRWLFALTRLGALATAIFVVVALPQLIWFIGGISTGTDVGGQTGRFAGGLVGALLTALTVAPVAGLLASLVKQRGMAIVVVLLGLVLWQQIDSGIALVLEANGQHAIADIFYALHPQQAATAAAVWWSDSSLPGIDISGAAEGLPFLLASVLWIVVPTWATLQRFTKAGAL